MKSPLYILSLGLLMIFVVWQQTAGTHPDHAAYVLSVYAMATTLVCYFFFSRNEKQRFVGTPNIPWAALVLIMSGITVVALTLSNGNTFLNTISVALVLALLVLSYWTATHGRAGKWLSVNNVPAIVNLLVLVPLVFRGKSAMLDTVYGHSILNSPITVDNMSIALPLPLILLTLGGLVLFGGRQVAVKNV